MPTALQAHRNLVHLAHDKTLISDHAILWSESFLSQTDLSRVQLEGETTLYKYSWSTCYVGNQLD